LTLPQRNRSVSTI